MGGDGLELRPHDARVTTASGCCFNAHGFCADPIISLRCPDLLSLQEPGSNQTIKQFAKSNYGVTFPLMSKVDVNGPGGERIRGGYV